MMAKSSLSACYAFDDNYAPFALVSLRSLLTFNSSDIIEVVYILGSNLSGDVLNRFSLICDQSGVECKYIDVAHYIEYFQRYFSTPIVPNASYAAYARLLIPYVTSGDNNILYLDCDTLVLGSLADLADYDFQNSSVAAVEDLPSTADKSGIKSRISGSYVNSGVLLFNKDYLSECVLEKLLPISFDTSNLVFGDQDLINLQFNGEFAILNRSYNCQPYYYEFKRSELMNLFYGDSQPLEEVDIRVSDAETAGLNPIVIHFCHSPFGRPWEKFSFDSMSGLWWGYVRESDGVIIDTRRSLRLLVNRIAFMMLGRRRASRILNARLMG